MKILEWIEAIRKGLMGTAPKRKRLEFRRVLYPEAEDLLIDGWIIAPEEDTNRQIGVVCLERLEPDKAIIPERTEG